MVTVDTVWPFLTRQQRHRLFTNRTVSYFGPDNRDASSSMITHGRKQGAAGRRMRGQAGLTLPEVMVASAVFGLTVSGFIYCQLFGMRLDELVNSKIGASDQARLSFNQLANDIRAAKIWQIGNGNLSSFTGIPLGTNQQGNALKLSLTTDTNQYYLYYFDTNACALYRGHSGSTTRKCLAQYPDQHDVFPGAELPG